MTDLNSLSKEELIKLVTQKEEQIRTAKVPVENWKLANFKFSGSFIVLS